MVDKSKTKDPYASREAKNYANPIASREHILDLIKEQRKPIRFNQLAEKLGIFDDESRQALTYRLGAMIRDVQLTQNRQGEYSAFDENQLVTGRLSINKEGFGFIIADDGKKDIFVSTRETRKAFHGDLVKVLVTRETRQGKRDGDIIRVIKSNTHHLAGRLVQDTKSTKLIAENPKIHLNVFIDNADQFTVAHDDIVSVELTKQPSLREAPRGIIKQVIGKSTDPGIEIEIATRNFDIPWEWPQAVLDETAPLTTEPKKTDINKRIDLRQLPFITIDGEDARDFDDAVFCESKKSGGWRLFVAIADVAHYVDIASALDKEAYNRGTSVYFPERVIPMLPEKISNGLCSLMPKVNRLAMICEMTISNKGRLSGYHFYEAVIHSHARLTYNEVGDYLNTGQIDQANMLEPAKVLTNISHLHALYTSLKAHRSIRGAIDFETQETRMVLGPNKKIEAIIPVVRNDAHKLIEECMLLANVACARFLEKQSHPALYRVHEGPSLRKLDTLRAYLGELGLSLAGANRPTTKDYQALMAEIVNREDAHLIQTMVLRSMSQAKYEPDNQGHFGLAYNAYAHFTSPIRRYPDLMAHRAIKKCLYSPTIEKHIKRSPKQPKTSRKHKYPYDMDAMLVMGEHCSMTERRADDATRDVIAWLKCDYLASHIGQDYEGRITAVTAFGFFVELNDLYIEGLVHVSQLENDYFTADLQKQRLVGERTRRVYRLGDPIHVLVSGVDKDERRIHLIPNTQAAGAPKKPRKRKAKSPLPPVSEREDIAKNASKKVGSTKKSNALKSKKSEKSTKTTKQGKLSAKASGKKTPKKSRRKAQKKAPKKR
ncbi:MAG: ribonuclease R [Cellvibrionales bacterium]|nr:ribonuclease R [Cellvibrionales bacterium]